MARHTIYLRDDLEPLLLQLLEIRKEENPGTEPSVSAVFSDALWALMTKLSLDHIKQHGPSPRQRELLDKFVSNMEAKGERLGL